MTTADDMPTLAAPADTPALAGLRVVDLSTGIAGGYCTKLLVDAGADVVQIEPPEGDPLRRTTACASIGLGRGEDSAVFQYLRRGQQSVVPDDRTAAVAELAAGADVRFTGLLDAAALAELRTRAAVVLAPSRWEEPCPYSVLEALAAGVPVLASDRGGLPELVGEGATLPATDQGAWSDALSELWQNPGLRAKRGAEALARAHERFGEDRFYDRLIQLYGAVSS